MSCKRSVIGITVTALACTACAGQPQLVGQPTVVNPFSTLRQTIEKKLQRKEQLKEFNTCSLSLPTQTQSNVALPNQSFSGNQLQAVKQDIINNWNKLLKDEFKTLIDDLSDRSKYNQGIDLLLHQQAFKAIASAANQLHADALLLEDLPQKSSKSSDIENCFMPIHGLILAL